MKRLLLDANVVLDVLLDRKPWAETGAAVWAIVETGRCEGVLAAHAVTTIHYLLRKETGNPRAKRVISAILRIFRVAAVDSTVLDEALQMPLSDFEDAVTAAAARVAGCDYIVTRNPKGFRGSLVRPFTPERVLPLFEKT